MRYASVFPLPVVLWRITSRLLRMQGIYHLLFEWEGLRIPFELGWVKTRLHSLNCLVEWKEGKCCQKKVRNVREPSKSYEDDKNRPESRC